MENIVQTFKACNILKLYNFLFVMVFCTIISLFSKTSFQNTLVFLLIISGIYLLYIAFLKSLKSIDIYKNEKKIDLNFNQFIFFDHTLSFTINEFYFSYKDEVGARGSKSKVFIIYNINKEIIIKLNSYGSGWDDNKITTMLFLWRQIGVQELY